MRKKYLIVSIILALVIISGAIAHRARAQSLVGTSPALNFGTFGGYVQAVVPCSCSGNWRVFIGPPVGGIFMYNNTPQYAYSQLPRAHEWTIGLYTPGGVCLDGDGCDPKSSGFIKGTITRTVGTSMSF